MVCKYGHVCLLQPPGPHWVPAECTVSDCDAEKEISLSPEDRQKIVTKLKELSEILLAAREEVAKVMDPDDMFGECPGQIAYQAFDEAGDRLEYAIDEIRERWSDDGMDKRP